MPDYEKSWKLLKKYITEYRDYYKVPNLSNDRYCISISCDDLLERMNRLENEES